MAEQVRTRLTAADYYRLPDYAQHDLIQLIDGEVILSMPPVPRHQAIAGEILFFLMTIAKKRSGRAFTAPIEVYLDEHNSFEPDVLYLSSDTACQVGEKRLIGAPDLVVEVLSPRTAKFDRQEKYQAYERHGVREYWIVDPVHETIEMWSLREGHFDRQGAYGREDTFQSSVLNETISVDPFFEV